MIYDTQNQTNKEIFIKTWIFDLINRWKLCSTMSSEARILVQTRLPSALIYTDLYINYPNIYFVEIKDVIKDWTIFGYQLNYIIFS